MRSPRPSAPSKEVAAAAPEEGEIRDEGPDESSLPSELRPEAFEAREKKLGELRDEIASMRKKVEQSKLEKQKAAQSKQEKLLEKELKQVLREYEDLKRDQSFAGSGE